MESPLIPLPIVVDFETRKIEPRPDYPPKPTSVSIRVPGKKVKFLSWGHPSGNNSTFDVAKEHLQEVWRSNLPVLFHHAKFDLDVANVHFGLPMLPWQRVHDTLYLLFMQDPHAISLGLKPAAEKLLGIAPDEKNELYEYIVTHIFTTLPEGEGEVLISASPRKKAPFNMFKVSKKELGGYISYAPGALVGKYADGDTLMTGELFKYLYDKVVRESGMLDAYHRELKLLPILLKNERRGVHVSLNKLRRDKKACEKNLDLVDEYVNHKLGTKGLDINKTDQLADALEAAGMVDKWVLTPGGKRSIGKENVEKSISNRDLVNTFKYRAKLQNTLVNFIKPWLVMAKRNDGHINFSWNQVRTNDEGAKKSKGARTGRLSSSPNAQNATNEPAHLSHFSDPDYDGELLVIPKELKFTAQLPRVRSYIVPDVKGGAIIGVDWAGQELRLLGHFEDTTMLDAYQADPLLDFHARAQHTLSELLGIAVTRKQVKALAFCVIYGGGVALLAKMLGVDEGQANAFRNAYYHMIPGLKVLINQLKRMAREGKPVYTLGGREYFVEPPRIVKGRVRTFDYKLLNIIIQGSAGDCMKQAIINYDEVASESARMLLTVHDEIIANVDNGDYKTEIKLLGDAMTEVGPQLGCDVSFPTDAEWSKKSWAEMKEYVA